MRNIRAVNLNLIPALRVLLRFRQVSRAAKALNMSQSSVSELLGALRHLFHDELVVSEGNCMRLTALGERLEAQIEAPLKLVDCLASSQFSGYSAKKPTIDIAASDYVMAVLAPRLTQLIHANRPELALRFHCVDADTGSRISAGEIDFLVTPEIPIGLADPQFAREELYEDRVVAMVHAGSQLKGRLTEQQFWSAPHVFFHPNPDIYNPNRTTVLQYIQERRPDVVLVESHLLVPFFVEQSEAIALMSSGFAQGLMPAARVRLVEAPFDIRVRVFASWDGSRALDANRSWFLEQLLVVSQQLASGLPHLQAPATNPRRWARHARNWQPIAAVTLDPERNPVVDAALTSNSKAASAA
jgi:LysR family transcriptional regulator, nod-box dependent transcriptional activator